jgi:hypothetical protein
MAINSQVGQRLGLFIVMGAGLLFAWLAGNYVAAEDYTPIAALVGILVVISIVFGLGKSIYILIPICWGLTGKINALPLPFNVFQLLAIIASVLLIADLIFKRSMKKTPFETVDLWITINLLYIMIGFCINPVGVAAIGGSVRVGGKPYIDLILGCLVYLMLSRLRITPGISAKIPKWVLAVAAFTMVAGAIGLYLPSLGEKLAPFYSAFSPGIVAGPESQGAITAGTTRLSFLQDIGGQLIRYVVSKINPTHLFHPQYVSELLAYVAGLIMIMMSGFRSAITTSFLLTLISAILRDRIVGVAKILFTLCLTAVLLVSLSYTSIRLPYTFQRTISFLPGDWDQDAVMDAENSSEWRFEMWRMALTSDRYINNKILGDGFGFLRKDYERGLAIMNGQEKLSATDAKQEMFLLDGDYHSGPVGAIRFVGAVGLALLLPLLYLSITYALRLIRRAEGSPYQFCVLFFALPTILFPFCFLFIFGDYRRGIVELLFNIGVMKMLNFSLRDYQAGTGRGYVLNPAPSLSL